MDALDMIILREMGMEPFIAWPRRSAGLRLSDIAERLGRNVQFVKDRVQRMEQDGVIRGYGVFPNLRQNGLEFTTVLWSAGFIPEKGQLSRLRSVDGFVSVFWSLDSLLCVDLMHAGPAERTRRLELIREFVGLPEPPRILFSRPFPKVGRRLTPLDWRIIATLTKDARRPLTEVAAELGVSAKTVRNHYNTMWREGSIDTHVVLDFEQMKGIFPFGISVWTDGDGRATEARVLAHFKDRYIDHLATPLDGYCSFQIRVFAYTPAEVQALLREASEIEGVANVERFLVTGAYQNEAWLEELLARHLDEAPMNVSRSRAVG